MKSSIINIRLLTLVFYCLLYNCCIAQNRGYHNSYKSVSIVLGLQFHSFAMPFSDIESNFNHPGIFVSPETSYNKKETLFQQVTVGAYLNREIGNGIYLSTQFGYRPKILRGIYGEVKAGLSYLRVFHPTQAFRYLEGRWFETTGGKSQLGIPIDFGFGYSISTSFGQLAPHVMYQVTPALFYNESIPVNFYTNLIFGLRVKPLKNKE